MSSRYPLCGHCRTVERAIEVNHFGCFQFLIEEYRKEKTDQISQYLLYTPRIIDFQIRFSKKLIEEGADPNFVGTDLQTPLHIAVICGNMKEVVYFLKMGVCVDPVNILCRTPLCEAIQRGRSRDFCEILLQYGANPNFSNSEGNTILHFMLFKPNIMNIEILETLICTGANPHLPNKRGETPYQLCKDENIREIFNFARK